MTGFVHLDEFAVFEGLEQLINKSLVTVQHPLQTEARYGLLESLRQYAQGKLIETGEAGPLREKHVDFFIALVDAYGEHGFRQDYYTWRDRLALEGDNLRAVMEWIADDRPGLALHFAGMLLQFDMGWLHFREARHWLEAAIARQQYELAAQLLGAAQKARERLNAFSTDSREIDELEQGMSQLEAELGAMALRKWSKLPSEGAKW